MRTRWPILALLCLLASLLVPGIASASTASGAETRVWASDFVDGVGVGVERSLTLERHRGCASTYDDLASDSLLAAEGGRGAIDDVLGGLRSGRSGRVKIVDSADELVDVFGRLSRGGKSVEGTSYPGRMVELPDGTRVGIRPGSTSGGPTIDIYFPGGGQRKIHVGGGS